MSWSTYDRGSLSILWECGGTLSAAAISCNVIHKVYAFIAAKIIGGKDAPSAVGELGMVEMSQARCLTEVSYETALSGKVKCALKGIPTAALGPSGRNLQRQVSLLVDSSATNKTFIYMPVNSQIWLWISFATDVVMDFTGLEGMWVSGRRLRSRGDRSVKAKISQSFVPAVD
ncbi:hypothetical protein QJS10_CPA16g00562 [Acorus calamus]|uniref:Bacterial bifunctional deaminase-reductase C-terminal domain-containing protein n=1 Tax=Acorus calamus TaxID=4465 RepID=A0AAV9D477_ACOCL|nr:hypothetical protein QJS10_CPA16g00562 [Acorus calamus]